MSYEQLEKAVLNYFGDTSRSAEETKNDLQGLIEFIQTLVESIEADE